MSKNIVQLEHQACVEMLVWLANELARVYGNSNASEYTDLKGLTIEHDCQTWSEDTLDLLLRWDIMETCSSDPSKPASSAAARFLVTRNQIREMAEQSFEGKPDIDWVLAAFIERAVDFHGVSSSRVAFSVHEDFAGILNLLHELGYAKRLQDNYIWTDLIGPVMVQCRLWTGGGQSLEALAEAKLRRRIRELPSYVLDEIGYLVAQNEAINAVTVLANCPDWTTADGFNAMRLLYPGALRSKIPGD